MRDDYATACEAARTGEKGAGKPPSVRLVVADNNPNDPPETWLDRMARAAMQGILANVDAFTDNGKKMEYPEAAAHGAYNLAAAMLAEKRRRETKEVEE